MPEQTPQLRAGCGLSRGQGKPFEAFDPGQVNAVEDHLELAGGQLDDERHEHALALHLPRLPLPQNAFEEYTLVGDVLIDDP